MQLNGGPPPKKPEDRARRNKPQNADVLLPAEGYQGDIPPWPLPGRKVAADQTMWAELWRTPQAAAWARMGTATARMIARYVTLWRGGATVLGEIRQLEDRLGLNPMALRRLGWDIVQNEFEPAEDQPVSTTSRYAGLAVAVE